MSLIKLQTLDFSSLPAPASGDYIIGVDIDGLPKLKTSTGLLVLSATGSTNLQYHEVSCSSFAYMVSTDGLQPGGVYLITDFQTRHYIQYTDSSGDGTGLNEDVNIGSVEQFIVNATSVNTYNTKVISLQYPSDEIVWVHSIADRLYDHANDPFGVGKGHILYRKSIDGNSRDYDFRSVVFRRWNDGSGNYTIFGKSLAPNPFDYIDSKPFEEGYTLFRDNVIKSPRELNVFPWTSPYYLDNFIFSTYSTAYGNKVDISHGVTINSLEFSGNTITFMYSSVLGGTSSTFNTIGSMYFVNSTADISYNQIKTISTSTFSTSIYSNTIGLITDCTLGNLSLNTINALDSVTASDVYINTGDLIGFIEANTIGSNNFNKIELSNTANISNNTVNLISYCDGTNLTGNIATNITNNTFNDIVDNISKDITFNLSPNITNNLVDVISDNQNTGDISYNISNIISGNTSSVSNILSNNINYIQLNSNIGSIEYNDGSTIYLNSGTGSIIYNSVKFINDNNTYDDISRNVGIEISNNTTGAVIYNSVGVLTLNQGGEYSLNNGTSISSNIISASCSMNKFTNIDQNVLQNLTGNDVNVCSLNIGTYSSIIDNIVHDITNNIISGTISNNIGSVISYNISEFIGINNVEDMMYNTSTYIINNKSNIIVSNTASQISYNQVLLMDSNIVDIIFGNVGASINSNIGDVIVNNFVHNMNNNLNFGTMSSNNGHHYDNNTVDDLTYNKVHTIENNTLISIQSNIGQTLAGNIASLGVILDNNIMDLSNNTDFTEISNNTGNTITNNSFNPAQYYDASATFSWSGTPSVGDIATISYGPYTQTIVSTTSSVTGFVNQIYNSFPSSGFYATYSSNIFTLTATSSTTSYDGATFSIRLQGTYSVSTSPVFTGSLDDMTVNVSSYTQSYNTQYLLLVTQQGTPDKFTWFDNIGGSASNVSITGSSQTLSNGVKVTFASTTGHGLLDAWNFDVVPYQSLFAVTYSNPFANELSVGYTTITSNNVNAIEDNQFCSINSNNGLGIIGNISVNTMLGNNVTIIYSNYNFDTFQTNSGNRLLSCTGSTVSQVTILDAKNMNIGHSIFNNSVQDHVFLDHISGSIISPTVDMRFATYSTVSRYVWDIGGHYEEKANSTGLTWSGPISSI